MLLFMFQRWDSIIASLLVCSKTFEFWQLQKKDLSDRDPKTYRKIESNFVFHTALGT